MHLGNEQKEERKEEWRVEDGKGELKVPEIWNYTQHLSIPQVVCEEVQENRGKSVLPGRVAPSWGCWGCVEGAVHEVMVVTQVGPEKEREIERLHSDKLGTNH